MQNANLRPNIYIEREKRVKNLNLLLFSLLTSNLNVCILIRQGEKYADKNASKKDSKKRSKAYG
jgi:hypothetical protein